MKTTGDLQLLNVISKADAPTNYTYDVSLPPGGYLAQAEDGSIGVFDANNVLLAAVDAPWAKDANGRDVPTHYVVDGSSITQVVDHGSPGIAYPIVADPSWTWYPWGYAIKYTYSETLAIASQNSDAAALAILCGLLTPVPAVACGLAGVIISRVSANYVSGIASRGNCLQMNVPWGLPSLYYEVSC